MSPTLWRFVLFGILGIFGEVVFTSILDVFKTRRFRFHGFSFLWMFPIYGLLAILFPPLSRLISGFPMVVRGFIYMFGIYFVEYATGTLLTALVGTHIWRYTDRFNVKGQITLLYAPVWFAVGLIVEKYYPWVDKISRLLASN